MNFSAFLGIAIAIGVSVITAITSTDSYKVFLDYHAFTIVIGGTFAASLVSFSGKKLLLLIRIFFTRVMGRNKGATQAYTEIIDLARGYRENDNYLKDKLESIQTPFLKESIKMICDGGIEPRDMDIIMRKRTNSILEHYEEDAEIFKALAKFPPAFGLMGAVIGMIAMMQSLGGAEALGKVGPSLAVALVATLYGIAIANFIFLPIGENLTKISREDGLVREMVMDGVKLIRAKKHPLVVQEMISSHFIPSARPTKDKAA